MQIAAKSLHEDPLHDIESACRLLGGISPSTLYSWICRGRVKPTKVSTRVFVRESELERLVKDGR